MFPEELIDHIFSFLPKEAILPLRRVNKQFCRIANAHVTYLHPSDNPPHLFARFPKVTEVQLSNTPFPSFKPLKGSIKKLNLQDLHLEHNEFDYLTQHVATLHTFILKNTQLSSFAPLGRLSQLRVLDATHSNFNDSALLIVAKSMSQLSTLIIDECEELSSSGISILCSLRSLETLSASATDLRDDVFNALCAQENIRQITFHKCEGITSDNFNKIRFIYRERIKFRPHYLPPNNCTLL